MWRQKQDFLPCNFFGGGSWHQKTSSAIKEVLHFVRTRRTSSFNDFQTKTWFSFSRSFRGADHSDDAEDSLPPSNRNTNLNDDSMQSAAVVSINQSNKDKRQIMILLLLLQDRIEVQWGCHHH